MPLILEGMVTSLNAEKVVNVAPMGPIVDESMTWLHLRPFQTSRTYQNLKVTGCGVFHVVDDVLMLARAALGNLDPLPDTLPATKVEGIILANACRWYEFAVEELDDSEERTSIIARVVHAGRLKNFFGFHRARHAVLEAAILATRVHMLPEQEILLQLAALRIPVEKTAGPREIEAFALVDEYVRKHYATAKSSTENTPNKIDGAQES